MSKRVQTEVRIMNFFESAALETAQVMLHLCESIVKRRTLETVTEVPTRRKYRKRRAALQVTQEEKAAILGDKVQ